MTWTYYLAFICEINTRMQNAAARCIRQSTTPELTHRIEELAEAGLIDINRSTVKLQGRTTLFLSIHSFIASTFNWTSPWPSRIELLSFLHSFSLSQFPSICSLLLLPHTHHCQPHCYFHFRFHLCGSMCLLSSFLFPFSICLGFFFL